MPRADEAIVLAGGLGTRLRSVIAGLPKPLALVAGRPFLARLLSQLAAGGMRRVIIATGYMGEKVEEAIGARWAGMDIVYSREPKPLGTGGAIRLAVTLLRGNAVHLANGDTFLRYDPVAIERVVQATGTAMGVALAKVDDVGRYGAVEVSNGKVIAFLEKGGRGPGLINAGSYFLTAEGIAGLPNGGGAYSFENEVLLPGALSGQVAALDDTSDFIDIGVPDDYARAQHLFGP